MKGSMIDMSDKESTLQNIEAENKKDSPANLDPREEKTLVVDYDPEYDFLYVGFRVPSFATKADSQSIEIFYSTNDISCATGIQIWDYRKRVEADPGNGKLFGEELPFSGILNSLDIREKIQEGKSFTHFYSLYEVLQLIGQIC